MDLKGVRILVLFLFLLSFASFVSADQNGNINVELTRLESSTDYSIIIFFSLALLVVVVLSLSVLLLLRLRTSRPRPPKKTIDFRGGHEGFKDEGYYDAVFKSAAPGVELLDEGKQGRPVGMGDGASIDRYLKEDERIVINVLRLKHNSCTQATLRVATDFSKAKLSRLLSELEERGVIFKEQQGRKNLITLRE